MTKETKTISQQLCELCGVKPKKIEKKCSKCDLIMEECGCFDCYKDVYPDFENPENFVKLLEIKTLYGTILDIISTDYSISMCEDVINCLYLRIAGEANCDIDEIKQSIRDYDGWVWG